MDGKKNILLGIGNELNGDDAIGCKAAERISSKEWFGINAETVPENFIATIKRKLPQVLVVVDAAEMKLNAGEIRRFEPKQANSVFYSTHSLPVSQLCEQLVGSVGEIVLIGVQPKGFEQFAELSSEAIKAVEEIIRLIEERKWKKIPFL